MLVLPAFTALAVLVEAALVVPALRFLEPPEAVVFLGIMLLRLGLDGEYARTAKTVVYLARLLFNANQT